MLFSQAAARATAQQQAQQQAVAPAPAVDRVGRLTALAELKAQGLLTDEECATEKARVLRG
ncbi:hypothetical protein ACFVX6_32185 [Streptomyces sp. NPDC058289]|uniref:hypothetical protein n=1 Tax=Streptomyces sp. NPDC058289 TaxID=3346425 RepID=UPI0036F0B0AB